MPSTEDPPHALLAEIDTLRSALCECYVLAGGDPEVHTLDELDSQRLGALVIDCVRDLRGFFDAARRDLS